MSEHLEIHLQETPQGQLQHSHFAPANAPTPEPGDGEVLVRTLLLSIDAANRAWMQGATYREAVEPGGFMHGYGIGEVIASNASNIAPGALVQGEVGWREYAVLKGSAVASVGAERPLSHQLSVFGIAGKTAYHGLMQIGKPQAGDTLVVSAAAGSVGNIVGQIGKIKGCRVIGVAGGAEKCNWLTDELGFDAAVDYKAGNLFKDLAAACPDGIDIYFDNTGGAVLETVLFLANNHARIPCCGAISQYDTGTLQSPRGLPGLLVVKRLRMEGFIVMDYADADEAALTDMRDWVTDGSLKVHEDIMDGLENAPEALISLLNGGNRGKRMVRVAADSS